MWYQFIASKRKTIPYLLNQSSTKTQATSVATVALVAHQRDSFSDSCDLGPNPSQEIQIESKKSCLFCDVVYKEDNHISTLLNLWQRLQEARIT